MEAVREEVPALQGSEHDPVVGQDELPGKRPDHERHEEGQQEEEQERRLVPSAMKGDPIGQRIASRERDPGGD